MRTHLLWFDTLHSTAFELQLLCDFLETLWIVGGHAFLIVRSDEPSAHHGMSACKAKQVGGRIQSCGLMADGELQPMYSAAVRLSCVHQNEWMLQPTRSFHQPGCSLSKLDLIHPPWTSASSLSVALRIGHKVMWLSEVLELDKEETPANRQGPHVEGIE
jgi:hypothetical protein